MKSIKKKRQTTHQKSNILLSLNQKIQDKEIEKKRLR
jgi:hypothetical protein